MKLRLVIFLAFTFLLSMGLGTKNAAAQQLFKNGDFNATTSYYTTACSSVEATYYESTYGGSSSTNHVAEVDDESCFYQDVCVLPGMSYVFSMDASRRTAGGAPNPVTTHLKITGLDASSTAVATYVDMDFSRTNTTFAFTAVASIPVINVAAGSGVVRLRVLLTDNTTGYSTLGMIVDNLSLTFVTPPYVVTSDTVCLSSSEGFTVGGVPSTGIYYLWGFGATGSPSTSTAAGPSVTWSSTGNKDVNVVLGNGTCYVDTLYDTLNVRGGLHVVLFDSICANQTYVFHGDTLRTSGVYVDSISSAGGCDSVITLNFYVKEVPSAPAISGDTMYCVGQPFVPFTVAGTGVQWYGTASGGTGSGVSPVVSTASAGSYTFYASLTNMGCEGPRAPISVSVYNNSTAGFSYQVGLGCARDTVSFINTSQYASSYTWYFGDGFSLTSAAGSIVHYYLPVHTTTSFIVQLDALNDKCASDSTTQVIDLGPSVFPKFLTNVTSDETILHGNSVQLNADGALYYYWSPNDGSLTDPNISNPVATPSDSTLYTVYGYDNQGCKDSAFVSIGVRYFEPIFIPSAFTPNGDGINDVFSVARLKLTRLVLFSVYNKWGQLVFNTTDPKKGWDGTFNGEPQDIGVYNYLIIAAESDGVNKTYKGDVTLIR